MRHEGTTLQGTFATVPSHDIGMNANDELEGSILMPSGGRGCLDPTQAFRTMCARPHPLIAPSSDGQRGLHRARPRGLLPRRHLRTNPCAVPLVRRDTFREPAYLIRRSHRTFHLVGNNPSVQDVECLNCWYGERCAVSI